MPSTPAITTGMIDFITRSGFITPIDDTPTPDLAVPYAAPRSARWKSYECERESRTVLGYGGKHGTMRAIRALGMNGADGGCWLERDRAGKGSARYPGRMPGVLGERAEKNGGGCRNVMGVCDRHESESSVANHQQREQTD